MQGEVKDRVDAPHHTGAPLPFPLSQRFEEKAARSAADGSPPQDTAAGSRGLSCLQGRPLP